MDARTAATMHVSEVNYYTTVKKGFFMNTKDAASCFVGVAFGLYVYSKSYPEFLVGSFICMICFLSLSSPSDIVEAQLEKYAKSGPSLTRSLQIALTWPMLWCSLIVLISLTRHWGLAVTVLYSMYVLVASRENLKYVTASGIVTIFFTASRFVQGAPEWNWFRSMISNTASLVASDQICSELEPQIIAVYWGSVLAAIFFLLLLIDRQSIFTENIMSSPLSAMLPAPHIATYDLANFWLKGIRRMSMADDSASGNALGSGCTSGMRGLVDGSILSDPMYSPESTNATIGTNSNSAFLDMSRKESSSSTSSRPRTRSYSTSVNSRSNQSLTCR